MEITLLSDILFSNISISKRTKDILLILGGSWILAALAQIAIYLPFTIIPITGQTFGVLLVAVLLGSKRSVLSIASYIGQGAAGLPFFAGGTAGLSILRGPTAGYLLGFLIASYCVGYLAEKAKDRKFQTALPSFLLGYSVIFACGIIGLSQFVGFKNAAVQGLLPFIPGEILKVFLLSTILPAIWKKFKPESTCE